MAERLFSHTHGWFAVVPPPGDDADPRPCIQLKQPLFNGVIIRFGSHKMLDQPVDGLWPVQYEWTLIAYPEGFDLEMLATNEFRDVTGQILLALMEERVIAIEQLMQRKNNE